MEKDFKKIYERMKKIEQEMLKIVDDLNEYEKSLNK